MLAIETDAGITGEYAGGDAPSYAQLGMFARYLLGEGTKPARKHLAAVKLEERLKDVEHRLGRVSRIKEYLEDMAVKRTGVWRLP